MIAPRFRLLLSVALLAASLGCRAQQPPAGTPLTPEMARRVEVLVRTRAKIPPNYIITVGPRQHSEFPGYDAVDVTFTAGLSPENPNNTRTVAFLLSTDGKTLAQLSKYDISQDPRTLVSSADRPSRGGGLKAPVQIVGFDDLECPYCGRMHAQLFPALLERYGDKVNIVYQDYPLSMHPWAMRAAVDVNCLAAQNPKAYWDAVDEIHAHGSEFGGSEHSLAKADDQVDQATLAEAKKDGLKQPEVEACIKKQDESGIKASMKLGDSLDINSTPILYINGEKLEGVSPTFLQEVFHFVDSALIAQGQTPPPPYVPPTAAPSSAVKPGS